MGPAGVWAETESRSKADQSCRMGKCGACSTFSQISDATTLFLLSADATPEDVRQLALDRRAADDPPTRKEVQERKRQSQGVAQSHLAQEVKAALKISSEARHLAASAEHITTRQLMDELDLDDLPKGSQHQNQSHVSQKRNWLVQCQAQRLKQNPLQSPYCNQADRGF